jgi:transposase
VAFKYTKHQKVLIITPEKKVERCLFAQNWLNSAMNQRCLLFSDEKWFFRTNINQKVWKIEGMSYPGVTTEQVQYPMKVLIWGCIGYNFRSKLIFFDGILNSDEYFEQIILGSNLLEEADRHFGGRNWIFMQDNAPAHVSESTLQSLDYIGIHVLEEWPPGSPELNPIEILWAIMSKEVEKRLPDSKDDLKNFVQYVWNNIPIETITSLIDSFPQKLMKVLQLHGDQVHY